MTSRIFQVVLALAISVAGSVLFAVAFVRHDSLPVEGFALFLALAALATGVILWALKMMPQEQVIDNRDDYPSDAKSRAGAQVVLERGIEELDRHSFVLKFMFAAFGALGLAALFPLRSLAPTFGKGLYDTKWRKGARVVLANGDPVRVSDLEIGTAMTVFPEGYVGDANSQTLLLRLPPDTIHASTHRRTWSPQGCAAFSKICTHAGCPVGLYLADTHQLFCPCHQSLFNVVDEAKPISGPASRPLPQLPLQISSDGYLEAQSDYQEPVGPDFWERS